MTTINTNVQSLNAQRNLSSSTSSLSTSMQRLSSGLRVNSAKDDAAGLAISERMNSQVKGMNVAIRNANDGISLAQTAEGALGKVGDMLQRIRELAVQSANATNSASDRASLQSEASQLKDEIDRVANTTKFNGTKLLDGSFTSQAFQVGANQGETISIASIADTNVAALGEWTSVATPSTVAQDGAFASVTLAPNATAQTYSLGDGTNTFFTITGEGAAGANVVVDAARIDQELASATLPTGVTFTGTAVGGDLVFHKADGSTFALTETTTGTGAGFTFEATAGEAAGTAKTGFSDLDISTVEGANNAILAMDAALNAVSASRGDLGAMQSRFENAISTLQVNSENLSAARGRIVDADFAKETANLSRAQILQQAGTAMIAQANQLPQGVLSLLR